MPVMLAKQSKRKSYRVSVRRYADRTYVVERESEDEARMAVLELAHEDGEWEFDLYKNVVMGITEVVQE